MSALQESINENVKAVRRFFDMREWPNIEQACTEVVAENLPVWERQGAARRITRAYEAVSHRTYNGQERAEALAQAETWRLIERRLLPY